MLFINQKNIPSVAGVYIFLKNKRPVYIGKAANLKKRLASYFRKNQSVKTGQLVKEATNLKWIKAESEIDALIKEAELIKKYRPKYNIVMRDDKNYFYVAITREKFPKIYITHQVGQTSKFAPSANSGASPVKSQTLKFIGPFTNGAALKSTLRLLRRIFPYCTCRMQHKRPCLNYQIGRCLGCCCLTSYSSSECPAVYKENTKNIIFILRGRKQNIIKNLNARIKNAVKEEKFENAAKLRDQIFGLENIFKHRQYINDPLRHNDISEWKKIKNNLKRLLKTIKNISRVEGYDISNISGKEATGSMVVFINGEPAKNEYRKFRIKTVHQISDVDMMKEVLKRRFKHPEWHAPDFILIDGGKPQLNAARIAFGGSAGNGAIITSLAKREEELYIESRPKPIKLSDLPRKTAFFLQRVRDESHRFAKKYHHELRKLAFKNDKEY